MTGAQYIVDSLIRKGVTDAFGIPGSVVLDLLYAMDTDEGFTPHLSYHEQAAGFAAIGYAQACGRIGVAYATRGPGFTNLLTSIAEAYSESLPVIFFTGHVTSAMNDKMRVVTDQELDTCAIVKTITKYAYRVENAAELPVVLEKAYTEAMTGRKGPVMLDIATKVFVDEVSLMPVEGLSQNSSFEDVAFIADAIMNAKRPVLLIGDGVNLTQSQNKVRRLADRMQIPVLSSRFSHDVLCDNALYFGYVGSHGIRYANFVLSKADLIVTLGNRLHFPVKSASYKQVTDRAKIIRIDIDQTEFERKVPNSQNIEADLSLIVEGLLKTETDFGNHQEWLMVCKTLRTELNEEDLNPSTRQIEDVLAMIHNDIMVVADVGNNEFWLSRACVHSKYQGRVLYSKSFGSLGCSICKAIGAYYATKKPVICFAGDQGFQMNIQELQFIAQHHLPILIVLMNNNASGMIKDREQVKYGRFVHTTESSGYGNPDFRSLAAAYGLQYIKNVAQWDFICSCLLELTVNPEEGLSPSLPAGRSIQDMVPEMERTRFEKLDGL